MVVDIGAMPVLVRTDSPEFLEILENRYGGFVNAAAEPVFEFEVEIVPPGQIPGTIDADDDLSVRFEGGRWVLRRGDFHAELDPALQHGHRQAANPYAIDAAFRIRAFAAARQTRRIAGACRQRRRNGRAFLFAGVSGAGKTTISRLAPPDATLLTDEISYLRRKAMDMLRTALPSRGNSRSRERTCARRWLLSIFWRRGPRTGSNPSARRMPRARCSRACSFSRTIRSWWAMFSTRFATGEAGSRQASDFRSRFLVSGS